MSVYITTPIYYVNDQPHLGHAYTTIAADVYARFKRIRGEATFFVTGTDEHGKKIEEAAKAKGLTPQQLADQVSPNFEKLWKRLNISYDRFIRTTEDEHKATVKALWNVLERNKKIYLSHYTGLYCNGCEQFYTEKELINGNCPIHNQPATQLSEASFFFKLYEYKDYLLSLYKQGLVQPPERSNEIKNFVEAGLDDLSISRSSFKWGIPVPSNPAHVIYVWLDALTNYISALGWNPDSPPEFYKYFWEGTSSLRKGGHRVIHFVGKDIVRFHAVYWPAFLKAANIPPPTTIFAHGWWTVEGQKMSKSLGNVIDPNDLIDRYGADIVRYYLLRATPFGNDGNFSHQELITRVSAELSNGVGNLLHRILSLIEKYSDSYVPPDSVQVTVSKTEYDERMEKLDFYGALECIVRTSNEANTYIQSSAPWTLIKNGHKEEFDKVMTYGLSALQTLCVQLAPFVPTYAEEMWKQLGLTGPITLEGRRVRIAKGKPVFPSAEILKGQ